MHPSIFRFRTAIRSLWSLAVGGSARLGVGLVVTMLATSTGIMAADRPEDVPPLGGDIPAHVVMPRIGFDYDRRDIMVPMRDGVRLHTVIVVPHGAHDAPILLTRTPYNASQRAARGGSTGESPSLRATLPQGDDVFADSLYIRVFQDLRGKYGSEGEFQVTRPPRGPFNASDTDDTTDAWDTIEWLVHNVAQSNGRVGMIGSSYEGWAVVMALLDPHPALRVAAPESPMVDGWMGDDWFHYGAFRQPTIDGFAANMAAHGDASPVSRTAIDDYETFLRAGSAGTYASGSGMDQFPAWRRIVAHPAYDAYWQAQALDKLAAARPSAVPTLWEQGLWDQEDMWGAIHSWLALRGTVRSRNNHLVIGPWRHSQVNYDGERLGPLDWHADTALDYRRHVLRPFFDRYLRERAPEFEVPAALVYNTGDRRWNGFARWPVSCEAGCATPLTPLLLRAGSTLSFDLPTTGEAADTFVSDPEKPVPYLPRPVSFADDERWKPWLTTDQRAVADRPDVLVFETAPLGAPLRISGQPEAELWASTTGTDADWVVKVIDVYPPDDPSMSGYQLPIAMDIFRGRYRNGFDRPEAIPANQPQRFRFTLPPANHVFLSGHRIMVQVQSSWFPLYDRNPQTFVPNIFLAAPGDYQKATEQVLHDGTHDSAVWLPVVSEQVFDDALTASALSEHGPGERVGDYPPATGPAPR